MLFKSRIFSDAPFQFAFALYLGYVFAEFFLKGLIPDALAAPGALISGAAFFCTLRWLAGQTPQAPRPQAANTPAARNAAAPKVSSCGKRCLLPPISFKHALFPSWLSASRNRVFSEKDKSAKPRAMSPAQLHR